MIHVSKIVSTCIGIEDSFNSIPHSYIFLPPSKDWSDFFTKRMMELMELEGENFLNDYEEEEEEEEDANERASEDECEDDEDD